MKSPLSAMRGPQRRRDAQPNFARATTRNVEFALIASDSPLPAGDAHVARYGRPIIRAVNDEIMALGFAGDRLADRRIEKHVPFRGAERGAQIGRVFVPQTHVKCACARHPQAITGLAKIVGQRRDEANQAAGLPDPHVPRRSAGVMVSLLQTEMPSELRAHFRQR